MAANTDLLRKKKSNFSTTLSSGINDSVQTIPLSSASGLPTDTAITLTIDRVDANGVSTPSLVERVCGVVSGSNLTNTLRAQDGTSAAAHASAAVVEDIWDADSWNDLIDALLVGHTQLGAHNFAQVVDSNGNETLKLAGIASAVNEITIKNAITGTFPKIFASGEADTGINFENSEAEEILILDAVASAVNEITILNAITGAFPKIRATGEADTGINFENSEGEEILILDAIASAVNEITIKNAATGTNPVIQMSGETNVGLDIKMKAAGYLRKPTIIEIPVFAPSIDNATGDGKAMFRVPEELNGMNLTGVAGCVYTAGTTNTLDVQIRNVTDSVDMLSTKLTIDSTEVDSSTAATPAVIDTTKDDVATGDRIAIDVDAIHTTAAKGFILQLRFELP